MELGSQGLSGQGVCVSVLGSCRCTTLWLGSRKEEVEELSGSKNGLISIPEVRPQPRRLLTLGTVQALTVLWAAAEHLLHVRRAPVHVLAVALSWQEGGEGECRPEGGEGQLPPSLR